MQLKVVWDLATFPPRNPNSMNLNELALSTRLRSLFKRDLGIQLVSELLERGAERLLEIPRFGKRELGYLRRKLRAHGLYLSGEGPVHASE